MKSTGFLFENVESMLMHSIDGEARMTSGSLFNHLTGGGSYV